MRLLLLAMWVGWLVYWAIAARGTKATQWHEPVSGLWLHNLLALLGTVVMAVPRAAPAILAQPFLPPSPIGTWLGVTLTALASESPSRPGSISAAIGAPGSRSRKTIR